MANPIGSPELFSSQFKRYTLPSYLILNSDESRLDASHYNPDVFNAINILKESGMRLERLEDIVDRVFIPPRFKRIYVDPEHGVPLLQGSHIVHFQPADLKYITKQQKQLEKWIICAGWILVTCSGTIGRTTLCPEEWHEWAASQHILRIVPDETKCFSGYLCSFLASPLGQIQLKANIYGAVVDELTEGQAGSVLVPLPETREELNWAKLIDRTLKESISVKSRAVSLMADSAQSMLQRFDT